jgi:hypothetical protein
LKRRKKEGLSKIYYLIKKYSMTYQEIIKSIFAKYQTTVFFSIDRQQLCLNKEGSGSFIEIFKPPKPGESYFGFQVGDLIYDPIDHSTPFGPYGMIAMLWESINRVEIIIDKDTTRTGRKGGDLEMLKRCHVVLNALDIRKFFEDNNVH